MTTKLENRKIVVIGGGTISHVRAHLAICAPAYGETARTIASLAAERFPKSDVQLYLTRMASSFGDEQFEQAGPPNLFFMNKWKDGVKLETNQDIATLVDKLVEDPSVKVIFFNPAIVDFDGEIEDSRTSGGTTPSGKYEPRLKTSEGTQYMVLTPTEKILNRIRTKKRKDITLIAFKTTTGATPDEQYLAGLELMKKNSVNLVLANDLVTRTNVIITPEEARYHVTTDRQEALKQLVDMAWWRSQMTFTRSTVVAGTPVPWDSPEVYPSLRKVVDYCIQQNAYKPFGNATVGHFACKIGEKTFLTSIRKSNFNELSKIGLVKVETDGEDHVIAYGAKPSVGGQSQRIIFSEHSEYDSIVHFHCPIKEGSSVPVVSQREYECGSHQCGQNTSNGLKKFGNLSAVMLDNHGPNIVFHHSIDPQEVIDFIEKNFDLSAKTGGHVSQPAKHEKNS